MSEELAWAGGFFDGEGSTYLEKHRTHAGYFYPVLYVPQAAEIGIAPELRTFDRTQPRANPFDYLKQVRA